MAEAAESLDDLMLGEVAEGGSESDEKFSERLAAAQAKIAGIKKDEKKAQNFDQHLAQLLKTLSPKYLNIVIFLIDWEVPSLTILAILSVISEKASKTCSVEFEKFIDERADFSPVKFGDPQVEEKISLWWTFIFGADLVSTSLKLRELKNKDEFVQKLTHYFSLLLRDFLIKQKVEGFDQEQLKKVLIHYEKQIFSGPEA